MFDNHESSGIIKLLTGVQKPLEIVDRSAVEVLAQLDEIMDEAHIQANNGTWQVWSRDKDLGDRRTFSPWFDTETRIGLLGTTATNTRLHVVFPKSSTPQPIIHVEKQVIKGYLPLSNSEVYDGFEIVWNLGKHNKQLMIGIHDRDAGQRVHVGERDRDPAYWSSVVKTIDAAHEAFVKSS